MSERIILSTDANQIRNLADAMRDLERILASAGISRELEAISGSLAQMTSLAQAPVSALGTLNGTLMGFASLAGATAAIYSIRNALNTLGTSPKIAIAAVVIGGITAAINLLASAFGRGTGSANDFAEALANGTSGLDTRLDKLKRLRDLYEEQARLTEEWTEAHRALDGVLGSDELIATHERFTDLGEALTNVNGEMTALQEVVGTYNKGQIEAAIQTAIMEGAIEDAAEAISSLKAAYQEAYDAALTSINSQLGLFDRMNFEASKAVTEMASTWGYQAEDIQKHNENLQFAIQSELLPGV
ncbi:MAG: hypothetical protein FWD84_03055, partial [Oscillospiraceae bacterium]|nr:hypothetical protein [Oscillospiraceae bacterium]